MELVDVIMDRVLLALLVVLVVEEMVELHQLLAQEILHQYHHHKEILAALAPVLLYIKVVLEVEHLQQVQMVLRQQVDLDSHQLFPEHQ